MNNKKIITIVGVVALLAVGGIYFSSPQNKTEPVIDTVETGPDVAVKASEAPKKTPDVATKTEVKTEGDTAKEVPVVNKPQPPVTKFSDLIDMHNWSYNADDHVYYQLGITYCQTPDAEKYQKLALFVPEKYFTCEAQSNNKYSCRPDKSARIANYNTNNAPLVFLTDSQQYGANQALSTYQDNSVYTDAGLIYAHIGFRGFEHGAPATITDIKAAIRYLKHNSKQLPGNQDFIYTMGINEGAGLAAILAASGNSKDFLPYLQSIGAIENADDNIQGVLLYNPPSPPEIANEEYEWNYGGQRTDLSEEQQKISDKMAREYANYINRVGFIKGKALTLQYSEKGIHQSGSYHDYIKIIITDSLNKFLTTHKFPYLIPKSWAISEEEALRDKNIKLAGTYQTTEKFIQDLNARKVWVAINPIDNQLKVHNLETFNKIFKKKFRPLASFDGMDRRQRTNLLFGTNGSGLHFDTLTAQALKGSEAAKDFNADLYKQDSKGYTTLKRANMYNPFYYLLSSYGGFRTATVAPYWNIISGIFQTNAPLTAGINLYLAADNYPTAKNVSFHPIWGMGDISDIANSAQTQTFIEWIADTYIK